MKERRTMKDIFFRPIRIKWGDKEFRCPSLVMIIIILLIIFGYGFLQSEYELFGCHKQAAKIEPKVGI